MIVQLQRISNLAPFWKKNCRKKVQVEKSLAKKLFLLFDRSEMNKIVSEIPAAEKNVKFLFSETIFDFNQQKQILTARYVSSPA